MFESGAGIQELKLKTVNSFFSTAQHVATERENA
jgi:hypothetical protein